MDQETGLICTLCFQKFIGKQHFVAHFKVVHADELRKRTAPQSDPAETEWFTIDPPTIGHLKLHTLVCPVCSDHHCSTDLMVRHIEVTHLKRDVPSLPVETREQPPEASESEVLAAFVEGVASL